MGSVLSSRFCFSSLFQRKSKPPVKQVRLASEEASVSLSCIDPTSIHDNDVPPNSLHPVGELVPERYLVLLTEQMTEMLFRLMTCNETSVIMSANTSNQRTTLGMNIDGDNISMSSPNSPSGQLSPSLQSTHQSCLKCNMKMLTIQEFHELHNAFRQVDNDHDNFLTRDEIRTTLNYLFELTEYDIKEIISVFDTNKDDRISLEEYIEEMKHRLLHEFTHEEIKIAFDQADVQQNGHLTVNELKNAIGYLNLHLPNRRIVEIISDCIKNEAADSIDFVVFTNIVKSLHRREPITLQKFKPLYHITHMAETS